MFKTVIWATDGSAAADCALPFAKTLVEEGGTLLVVHNEEHFAGGRVAGYPLYVDEKELEAKLRGQVEELREEGLDAVLQVVRGVAGHSAHLIADLAKEQNADVIVAGTRGHGPVAGLFVGSVTQRLLHTAHCPVMVVPTSAETLRAARELVVSEAKS